MRISPCLNRGTEPSIPKKAKSAVERQDRFQPHCNVQERITDLQLGKEIVTLLFDDLCARIMALVNAMTEPHQSSSAFLVFRRFDETRSIVSFAVNLFEHFKHRLVCAAV